MTLEKARSYPRQRERRRLSPRRFIMSEVTLRLVGHGILKAWMEQSDSHGSEITPWRRAEDW
jgi:hypothetical protein